MRLLHTGYSINAIEIKIFVQYAYWEQYIDE